MMEDIQTDGIAELCELEKRTRIIMLTIPLCKRVTLLNGETATDNEGWPIYKDLGDNYRDGVIENLHTMFNVMGVENYAIGEEYGDDMTMNVDECRREDGSLRAYRHLHAVAIKPNNNPVTKKIQKAIAEQFNADIRTIKNQSRFSDVLNYVVKDIREGLYKENTIEKMPKEDLELITAYESMGMGQKPWIRKLNSLPTNRRTIHVILDKKGNTGKSFYSRYMWTKKRAFYINNCPNSASVEREIVDTCKALDKKKEPRPRMVIADLPRAKDIGEPIYWEAMERAINGLLTEDRYHTEKMNVNIEKAVMFCNNLPWDGYWSKQNEEWVIWPTLGTLESHDRFKVWEIIDDELIGPYEWYKENPNKNKTGAEYEPLIAEVDEQGDMIERYYTTKGGAGLYMQVDTKLRNP